MMALACALLSAVGFYFSLGLGTQWWLAWLAPIPILWLAFGRSGDWRVLGAACAAMALGGCSLLRAYAGVLPTPVLILSIGAPSLLFAISVMGARRVNVTLGPVAAMFAFATLWTAFDFLSSFSRDGGSIGTPAAAEVGVPALIQVASLVGFPGITFLLGAVSAGLAASLRRGVVLPAIVAVALLAADVGFGLWHMSAPSSGTLRVALVESDDAVGQFGADDRVAALKAVDDYVAAIDKLGAAGAQLIVLPENISRLSPAWRDEAFAKLTAAASRAHATLVAGFNTRFDGAQRNIAWAFTPGATKPVIYEKRRLVPVLESAVFTPGSGSKALANGVGLEICKDMDFQGLVRGDAVSMRPILLAVPAWDFDKDDWSHARVAILRSVENGLPMARSARGGLLTLNDRYGRLVAQAKTVGGFTVLTGDVALDGHGGHTIYDRIGDLFGWLCMVFSFGLVTSSLVRGRRKNP